MATIPALSAASFEGEPASIAEIEARVGGRVGVFALDTGSGKVLAHRPDIKLLSKLGGPLLLNIRVICFGRAVML
jgi:beta-lactamase class A